MSLSPLPESFFHQLLTSFPRDIQRRSVCHVGYLNAMEGILSGRYIQRRVVVHVRLLSVPAAVFQYRLDSRAQNVRFVLTYKLR